LITTDLAPSSDCARCPRLVAYRQANRKAEPDWHNAPVPSFGPLSARILIVGLAPGRGGANRTGRPFTGDYAGDLLYATLLKSGLANGTYDARPDDGVELRVVRITNAVRCVPPENKPAPEEAKTCGAFLKNEISAMPDLRILISLGRISHDAVLRVLGLRLALFPFAHGAVHRLTDKLTLADSFHCSRYNTNTGKLTPEMFEAVFQAVKAKL
jgi:uracil-DNA glycosylase family 4